MKKETTTISWICDCCGKEIDRTAVVSENCYRAITKIEFDVWYGGLHEIIDICPKCNENIIRLIGDFLETARKKE